MTDGKRALQNFRLPTELKLSLLWTSLMFLYIYNDYFIMYTPGTIERMSKGLMGPLGPATERIMVSVALLLAVPALMIFLSAALTPQISRWLNVSLGVGYTAIEGLTFSGPDCSIRSLLDRDRSHVADRLVCATVAQIRVI